MNETVKELHRLGYRRPRRLLLPPYMADPYFQEYGDMIDEVFKNKVDAKVGILRNLRQGWISNPALELDILDNDEMIDNDQWSILERDLLAKQVNSLGMYLITAAYISDESFQTIARFLGTYWWERGTYGFIEFMNFCLGIDLVMVNLWTEDYVTFVEEADAGTPIWEGGSWYRTTHVMLKADNGISDIPTQDIALFFYEIANYNLVLYSIDQSFEIDVVADPSHDRITEIVAYAVHYSIVTPISITRELP